MVTAILDNGYEVMAESIGALPWLDQAILDQRATTYAVTSDLLGSAELRRITWQTRGKIKGNKSGGLFLARGWSETAVNLEDLRQVADLFGLGVYASPASLGQALMARSLGGKRYKTLAGAAAADVRAALVGGRAELPSPWRGPVAYETDRRAAYLAEATKPLPIGPATIWRGPDPPPERYPWWVARCAVYLPTQLAVGPFPQRRGAEVLFPTARGSYEDVWLTRGEYADTLAAGGVPIVRRAWCWKRVEPVLEPWARQMFALRSQATSPVVAGMVKRAANAAIGWHAMGGELLTVHRAGTVDSQRILMNHQGRATGYVLDVKEDHYPTQMLAWTCCIWAEARRELYLRQLAEIAAGNRVLASNYDALILREPSRLELEPDQLGEWRQTEHTHVKLDHERWLQSDQADKRPGFERSRR